MKRRGISLVEILIVIAIIAILAALLFPLLTSARRGGLESTTLSNLRQCGQALEIYAPDSDIPPEYLHAQVALSSSPTTDLADYSKYKSAKVWPAPFIGSYAYLRGSGPFDREESVAGLRDEHYAGRNYPVMASVWHGKPKVEVFEPALWEPWNGTEPDPIVRQCLPAKTCILPDRITYLMSDGSAKVHKFRPFGSNTTNPMFLWWYVFQPPLPFAKP